MQWWWTGLERTEQEVARQDQVGVRMVVRVGGWGEAGWSALVMAVLVVGGVPSLIPLHIQLFS